MKKLSALVEVAAVLTVLVLMRVVIMNTGFGAWQNSVFGSAFLTGGLLFFVLPVCALSVTRKNLGHYGLTAGDWGYHARMAFKALSVLLPATMLFPLVGLLGTTPMDWFGATILTIGFAAAGCLLATWTMNVRDLPQSAVPRATLFGYAALLLIGVGAGYLAHLQSERLAQVVYVLLFVGFLEEFFFRGYVQSRLNDYFGRPFTVFRVRFGPGMVLAATLFGLFHPILSSDGTPWPWATWTATMGLVLGFLREKTGAVLAPALVHGAVLLPRVFFGS